MRYRNDGVDWTPAEISALREGYVAGKRGRLLQAHVPRRSLGAIRAMIRRLRSGPDREAWRLLPSESALVPRERLPRFDSRALAHRIYERSSRAIGNGVRA